MLPIWTRTDIAVKMKRKSTESSVANPSPDMVGYRQEIVARRNGMKLHALFIRNRQLNSLLELFLVSSVSSVLVIRFALAVSGYPQLGGRSLHIAHLLWGGLLMLVALVLLLTFLGRRIQVLAAVVGGAGFGTFVDELGKFITSDNDYFFRLTVGLLYVLFVVLFVLVRTLDRGRRPLAPDEALANATDQLRELVLGGASDFERARVLRLLAQSNAPDALAAAARAFVAAAPSAPAAPDTLASLAARVGAQGRRTHDRLVGARWFGRAVVFVFVANAVLGGAVVLVLGLAGLVALVGPE